MYGHIFFYNRGSFTKRLPITTGTNVNGTPSTTTGNDEINPVINPHIVPTAVDAIQFATNGGLNFRSNKKAVVVLNATPDVTQMKNSSFASDGSDQPSSSHRFESTDFHNLDRNDILNEYKRLLFSSIHIRDRTGWNGGRCRRDLYFCFNADFRARSCGLTSSTVNGVFFETRTVGRKTG